MPESTQEFVVRVQRTSPVIPKDGRDGADGRDGPPGPEGRAGNHGRDGQAGPPGVEGRTGANGANGRDGKDGVDGKDGKPGRNGVTQVIHAGGGGGGVAAPSVSDWSAADSGQIARTYDPAGCTVAVAPVSGTVFLMGIMVRTAATTAGVVMAQAGAGTLMTVGRNFLGLYDSTGTQVAVSPDLSVTWQTANQLVNPGWVTPAALTPGLYWIGLLANSTGVLPTFRTTMSSSASWGLSVNAGLTAATSRVTTNGSGATVLPPSFTPSANGVPVVSWWAAIR